RFLVYNPIWSQSHTTFMNKLSDVLMDAGHEVVVLAPVVDSNLPGIETSRVTKVISIPPCEASIVSSEKRRTASISSAWESKSIIRSLQVLSKPYFIYKFYFSATLNYPGLLESLKNERFDAAFLEPMDMCGYGIFHKIGIKSVATTISIGSYEGSFDSTGLPSFPSYVPGMMMQFSEQMTFVQRVVNTISLSIGKFVYPMFQLPTERVLQQQFGLDFPNHEELKRLTSLWFLNAEPLIEFPRPILHKMIDIGGITVSSGDYSLTEDWKHIMGLRPKTVLISFGTVAKSYHMPDNYKRNIIDVINKFPNVTFIWKYEKPEDKISENITNLVEATWIPQIGMLYDHRLSLFITHCGQGSTIEATTAGVPLIVVPIVGDQKRNAAVIDRLGSGIVLEKDSLGDFEKLENALQSALSSDKYREKARAVGEMIRNRPFSPRETFVRNMEFLARFGPLRMLDHYGRELNFIQYYLIDVFAFLLSIVLLTLLICFKIAKIGVSLCWKIRK
ncbi:hypothetical protein PENTCL1PPCAC_12722, partial [Pristionchus entomophagus]